MAHESERGPLRQLHRAFQTALIHDLTEEQFADTYAQTVTYGLLTAAIQRTDLQGGRHDTTLYSDMLAEVVPITNPFLKEMLQTFLHIGGQQGGINFDELGIQDVVDLLRGDETDLPAILRDFGNRTRGEDPVIHFYEHFLAAYDKKLKVQRGIFYTPQPVVSYIVRSVHELLQTEFGLADGLASTVTWGEMAARGQGTEGGFRIPEGTDPASPFVTILDPATGTATFLVEVIEVIYRHLRAKWDSPERKQLPGLSTFILHPSSFADYWNDYVPRHLLPRLHGYELMMAPYAIAHMKIGLKLHETGYRFGSVERVRVYLTNALEPPDEERGQLAFAGWTPALAHEAQAVNAIKRWQRFTVVIGNPPYSGHSANKGEWIGSLLRPYYQVDGAPLGERNPKWLQDDYVKFIRLGQHTVEQAGVGVLSFITNHGYLDNPTFRGMRQQLCNAFSEIDILDLHGNAKKKETAADGSKDENVFDIQQGVAVCRLVRRSGVGFAPIRHADLFGLRTGKYALLQAGHATEMPWVEFATPKPFYLFVPQQTDLRAEFEFGWKITDIFPVNSVGIVTARDALTIGRTADEVWQRVTEFAGLPEEAARAKYDLGPDARDWKVSLAQNDVRRSGPLRAYIAPILYRPFDVRFTYYTAVTRGFICMPRPEVMRHMLAGRNIGFHLCRQIVSDSWQHVLVTDRITDDCYVSNKTRERGYTLPLYVYEADATARHSKTLFEAIEGFT
ncbi:MAG: type ISP restriction/modification enzyme, partial [Anaerolineae bacterium]